MRLNGRMAGRSNASTVSVGQPVNIGVIKWFDGIIISPIATAPQISATKSPLVERNLLYMTDETVDSVHVAITCIINP